MMTIPSSAPPLSGRGYESEEAAAAIIEGDLGSARLRKELNIFDAVAVVVGTVIGSGIFLLPSFVAAQLHSLGAVLLVWLVGGILSLFGALSLAELGSVYPGTGGLCTYLRHVYGPLPAFLYAWALLLMIHTGSIAALAVAFGIYVGQVLPLSIVEQKVLSAGLILTLTVVSCFGIRGGKLVQNFIAVAKVSGLAGIILLLSAKGSRPIHFFESSGSAQGPAFSVAGFGVALVAVLWAYEGWHVLSFVAGEMKKPKLDFPRSLFYGSAIVMLIYLAATLGYYHVLSATEIRGSNAVAALAVGKLLGPIGASVISILIVVSILGSMNGLILSGPRVSFAMAREGIFPAVFGRLSARYRTPTAALVVQGVWAATLAASGSYQQLFTDVIFTAWIFYGLAVAGVLVLRRSQPHTTRSFSVPGYPWLSLLFCVAAAGVIIGTLIARPIGVLIGIGLVGTGIPVYLFCIRMQSATVAE
ncbi:MAG: amino acid permease [Terriglobales bacterium]|jgi:APA family basic amino acid/polyamine antiporter